ncbi:MAG TPA: vWA domain-containing protein [Polyangiales bacterium]|nr:vWA domain-containing protein [Polyangiales bacterium]
MTTSAAGSGKGAVAQAGAGGTSTHVPPLVDAGTTTGHDSGLVLKPAPAAGGSPAAGSGGSTGAEADCGRIRQQAEATLAAVDIVWVIDGSGSMSDEQAAIKKNIASFAEAIGGAGIDHHVVMVAEDDVASGTSLGSDAMHYKHVSTNVGSHDALAKLIESYPQYASFLRPGATLHFVIVTDDESRMKAADFQMQMKQLASKNFVAHAIVSESVSGRACTGACGIALLCGAATPGLEYLALSEATGGQKSSICVSDWSTVFEPLKTAVIESAPLPCDYELPAPPAGSSLDPLRVNVGILSGGTSSKTLPRAKNAEACDSAEAWFYDDPSSPKLIHMCPAACSSISTGGSIEITLGCETISLN